MTIHSNSLLRSKLIKIITEKSHIEGLLQLMKNILKLKTEAV